MPTQVPNVELPEGITRDNVKRVIDELENAVYKYRTVQGIASATGLEQKTVKRIIDWLGDEGVVMQSSVDDPDGNALYTTRSHFRQKSSFWERLRASLRNRAD
jgi:transcription initiation factor IIE alpha subunit